LRAFLVLTAAHVTVHLSHLGLIILTAYLQFGEAYEF